MLCAGSSTALNFQVLTAVLPPQAGNGDSLASVEFPANRPLGSFLERGSGPLQQPRDTLGGQGKKQPVELPSAVSCNS